jgi:hypothetical protein
MKLAVAGILEALEQLHYDVSTESRLVRVGVKTEQRIEPIMQRYDWLASRETVGFLAAQLAGASTADERERLDRARFSCLGDYVYKSLAPLDDRLHTELARTNVRLDGEQVSYYNLQPHLQREPDFARREAIGAAIDSVHASFNPIQLEMLQKDLALLTGELGFPSYLAYCRQKKQFDHAAFVASLRASLQRTDPLYRRHVARWCDEKLGRAFGNLNRYHVAWLMRLNEFDAHFPKESMVPRLLATLRTMGADLKSRPNILLDLEERERKNPRACCYAARVPGEVHLILKPVGGLTDYDTFLHEAGHALHYGNTDPSLPYEYRKLGRSYALSEIYAFTLQNIVMNADWLGRVMGLDAATVRRLRYYGILKDLYMYRRYCAKLLAEFEFFQRGDWTDGGIYARMLTDATGFIYRDLNYLFDMDGELYSADYLRAWIGEAQLAAHLEREFGSGWTADARTGEFLLALWRQGEKPAAEEVIAGTGQPPLDPSCLESRFAYLDALVG